MQDPVGNFERIREFYISYLDTAFRIEDESVAAERRALLRRAGTLCCEPLIEPLPRYEPDSIDGRPRTFDDILASTEVLAGFSDAERLAFIELVLAGLFPSKPRRTGSSVPLGREALFPPYKHQVQMLTRGVRPGTPAVVTSGTGSGKTEAFLLPLLARIAKEAVHWEQPADGYLRQRWWNDADGLPYRKVDSKGHTKVSYTAIPVGLRPTETAPLRSPFVPHRTGERRPAAMRGIVLYPMNALVEDQLVRLRKALDSREAREVMDQRFHGNRIFFGRYTGATPVTGHHVHPGFVGLLGTEKRQVAGDVYFPQHKLADSATGRVTLLDVRSTEVERRQRKLEALFNHQVELEQGQVEARLHALDRQAAEALRRVLAVKVDATGHVTGTDFLAATAAAGKRSEAGLIQDFRKWVGGDPTTEQRTFLAAVLLSRGDSAGAASAESADDAPFIFPTVDGSEMTNRWDMQETPPDLLITNVSMLSAMLNREVEAPLFEKTRAWLQQPDSYFYLVLDELHLQRGAAGTEVSYLIRLLLHRLGLTSSEAQRKKIHILASSASLPASPADQAELSARYLWDMFGPFGLPPGLDEAEGAEAWLNGIVPGSEQSSKYDVGPPAALRPEPFERLLRLHVAKEFPDDADPLAGLAFARIPEEETTSRAWGDVADACGVPAGELPVRIRACIEDVAARIAWACREADEGTIALRSRAIPLDQLAERLFVGLTSEDSARQRAMRALLFVRGAGDGLTQYLSGPLQNTSSFRVHTFFRSIEGLYAPATRGLGSPTDLGERRVHVGRLTIDQSAQIAVETPTGTEVHRAYELLYCECCGELLFGGMRAHIDRKSKYLAELLPQEPSLEGLPDQAVSQRFEDQCHALYAVFWAGPWEEDSPYDTPDGEGKWHRAYLERPTGGIIRADKVSTVGPELLAGWYYVRGSDRDRHKRDSQAPGSHVPYACPKCATSYSGRSEGFRLSPVRNFRAGFGKTTQLLATDLFDSQRVSAAREAAKLVSFSDSRQDAAHAALDIERRHHQDVRREILFNVLSAVRSSKQPESALAALEEARAVLAAVPAAFRTAAEEEVRKLTHAYNLQADPTVGILEVLENPRDVSGVAGTRRQVQPFVAAMVGLGIHPFDDAGQEEAKGQEGSEPVWFEWTDLFEEDDSGVLRWSDDEHQAAKEIARHDAVFKAARSLTDVIFGKTYFSFEEAGLGYAAVRSQAGGGPMDSARALELAAFLRVLTDSYRYWPTPYRADSHAPWTGPAEVTTPRVRRFAETAWPADPTAGLANALRDLALCGHADGVVRMEHVRIQLVDGSDVYVRCANCGRVHLHRGADVCTRCFEPLQWNASPKELVSHLHSRNFLGRRVRRVSAVNGGTTPSFRLHCEELTGQTEDPAKRQRDFKGIFLPDGGEGTGRASASGSQLLRRKEEVDLLTVTTTMEVGIDIGPLQVVMQANMPPQRFNYQQRVGRAGRRGQAFSLALTICRTKSHDLFYFRNPKRMTGDVPPTPFLTKGMNSIVQRFLRKGWLTASFRALRDDIRSRQELYPGDLMSPPDIHGEYLPAAFLPVANGTDWRARVGEQVEQCRAQASELADVLCEGTVGVELNVDATLLLSEIDRVVGEVSPEGLAQSLSEAGYLPMYGMPTRARQLYLGLRSKGERLEWSTVGRDLDVAIYEFAPGSTVTIDKREHLAIGFSPDLAEPFPGKWDQALRPHQPSAFGPPFQLLECASCHAWASTSGGAVPEECAACGSKLHPEDARECRVPNAFRTDLPAFPRIRKEDAMGGARHRSIQAEGRALDFVTATGFGPNGRWSLSVAHPPADLRSRTFRLNRGPPADGGSRAFEFIEGTERKRVGRQNLELPLQCISTDSRFSQRVAKTFQPGPRTERIWLASPKVTDALYVTFDGLRTGLGLHRLPGRVDGVPSDDVTRWIGVRAAAISASYLLANRASLELDIDPEEFDVLEPRIHGKVEPRPLLHMTDNLVNGAGFCEHLASRTEAGIPRVAEYIASMLLDRSAYPLVEFLEPTHECNTSCYKCLRRYGNQPFHALLDWQLGLAFLRLLVDPSYRCGLDGNFSSAELERWPNHADYLATQMAERFDGEATRFGDVPAFRILQRGTRRSPWVLVAHPLWDWPDNVPGDSVLDRARSQATEHGEPLCWDTFNLVRRQVLVRERIREGKG